ncbi:PIN domain-containing protein [Shewanella septentrionalis]|uniref:PIN domain-containing protein n=1 Tax=Shewanella septentrionalis TaxID=2952223 RepID=A0A9X2WZL4_9GAMM|nr:PIN domain-containing protein [Shewanella septentrionalis]MCT7947982.1 PIN domain-containing protein [Shewanella septentrionalis]
MLNVLLDTNILHEEGLNSTRIQRVQRLIKSNDLKLIVPEIVINEFKSKIVEQANSDLERIQSGLDSLQRKNILPKDSYQIRESIKFISNLINSANGKVDIWMKENNVSVYKISNTSIDELFASYFSGTGAFRGKKKREDIPDAVIYDGIVKISKDTKLIVIVKDGALLSAISKLMNVETYSSLNELLETPLLKERTEELDKEESKVKSILDALNSFDYWYSISKHIEENKLIDIKSRYENDFIRLPYEFEDIEISSKELNIKSAGDVTLSAPNYLGNKRFSLTMNIESKADFSFHCEDEHYELLPYIYRKSLTKELSENSSKIHAYGTLDVTLQGVVVIENIDENMEVSELKLHLSYLGADCCEIECKPEVESISVNDIY